MNDFNIQIDDNVQLPKREVNFGPRESKYPFRTMREGQGFAIPVTGKPHLKNAKGEVLTVEQDAERKARQKQSAFSGSAKRLGIKLNTRFVHTKPDASEPDASETYLLQKWEQAGGPFLLVVHGGARDAADDAAEGDGGDEVDLGDE